MITNRHNVTGKHQTTGKHLSATAGEPNFLIAHIFSNPPNKIGWLQECCHLYDENNQPLWPEHPSLGARADFIALVIDLPADLPFYPIDITTPKQEIAVTPAENVSVLGFPMGKAAGGLFPIWVSGFVASEPDIDYNDLPIFLIDCRTKQGQSGSPVFTIKKDMVNYKDGSHELKFGGQTVEFLGIYSGRIDKDSDIGMVWKRRAIEELINSI